MVNKNDVLNWLEDMIIICEHDLENENLKKKEGNFLLKKRFALIEVKEKIEKFG